MQEALAANGETAPEGSWDPVREPVPDIQELAKDMEAREQEAEAAPRPPRTRLRSRRPLPGTPAAEEPTGESR